MWSEPAICTKKWTSGIPGGYRLVSTYDLLDCKTILKFEIWSFFRIGGGILKLSDLDSLTILIGGVFCTWTWILWQFSFGGGYSVLGLGLSDNFHFGGVFFTWTWTLWQFSLGGYSVFQNRGYSPWIWTKISTTPAGSCITDSLSHTTYVETNEYTHIW